MKARIQWKATKQQRAAMESEINHQIADKMRNHEDNMDILCLYVLYEKYGWRKKRLRDFYNNFIEAYNSLIEYYEMPNDGEWLCRKKLEEAGINVEEWNNERYGKDREDDRYIDSN